MIEFCKIVQNASRPRRPHLWVRVLVCPWEVFAKQCKCERRFIGMWSRIYQCRSQMSPTWHPKPVKVSYKLHFGSPTGRFGALGRKNTFQLAVNGGHMPPPQDPSIFVFGIRFPLHFCLFYCIQLGIYFMIMFL